MKSSRRLPHDALLVAIGSLILACALFVVLLLPPSLQVPALGVISAIILLGALLVSLHKDTPHGWWRFQLLVVSCFGPYVIQNFGIRTEQVYIYSLLFLSLPTVITHSVLENRRISAIVFLWCSILFLATLITVDAILSQRITPRFHLASGVMVTWNQLLAGLDDYLVPISVLLLISAWHKTYDRYINIRAILNAIAKLLIVLLSINTIVSIISINVDLTDFLSIFWSSSSDLAVGLSAYRGDRLVGIFNQPVEAGLMYSLALLLWVYRYKTSNNLVSLPELLLVVFVALGGILISSKVFMYGGIPLAFACYVLISPRRSSPSAKFITLLLLLLGAFIWLLPQLDWDGIDRISQWYYRLDGSLDLSIVTGGRFSINSTGTLTNGFETVWNESPIFGLGFGNPVPRDNAIFEIFLLSGLVGLCLFLFIVILITTRVIDWFAAGAYPEGMLFLLLLSLIMASSTGSNPLILNRVSPIVWLLLATFLQRPQPYSETID